MDTGIFDKDEYVDAFIEYVKTTPDDILIQITLHNRSSKTAILHVLPTVWFRNTWVWGRHDYKPSLWQADEHCIQIEHKSVAVKYLYFEQGNALFCENETNNQRLYNSNNSTPYPKDGINNYIVNGSASINPAKEGTKAAIQNICEIAPDKPLVLRLRLSSRKLKSPFTDFDSCFAKRKNEADDFYKELQQQIKTDEEKQIQRQAFAGMLWNKQFYHYDVQEWLEGDPATPPPLLKEKKEKCRLDSSQQCRHYFRTR
jgi:hypothetical protein